MRDVMLTSYFKRKESSSDANSSEETPTKRMRPSLPECVFASTHDGPAFTISPPTFLLQTAVASPKHIVDKDLELVYLRSFVSSPRQVYNYLSESLPWYRVRYTARGIQITTPRYTTVFGKDETRSSDSTYQKKPRPIPPLLLALKEEVEKVSGTDFNFVLLNFYADGKDSIAYHSDDESFLGPHPTIASLSLGGTRDFYMRHKTDKSVPIQKFELRDADMLIMKGSTQSCWQHSIPKRSKAAPRINITFRKAINTRGTNNYYRYNVGDGPLFRYVNGQMVEASLPSGSV